ncbi:MAG: carboxypeptidase-like regulatory domain-containing protein [Sedimentisphaerales bacterium]
MRVKTIFRVLAIVVLLLFVVAAIRIGALFEAHTFRASVSGRVTDTQGNPIAGAKVEYCLPNSESIDYDQSTKTNQDGGYSVSLPRFTVALDTSPCYGRYVRISAEGYVFASTYQNLKKGPNPNCDFTLTPASANVP